MALIVSQIPPAGKPTNGVTLPAGRAAGRATGGANDIAATLAAALAWWRDAGVDCDYADAPHDWLNKPAPAPRNAPPVAPEQPPVSAPAAIGGGRSAWPPTASEFAEWWMTEPSLAPAAATRAAPDGAVAPALMIVVPMPAADDAGVILSGKTGDLLGAFLQAAGMTRDQVYCTATVPARIAAPDWGALATQGLGDLLIHHVGLIRPQRVILFGQSSISTLLGNALPNNHFNLPEINHDRGIAPALWCYDLETMLVRPALKAGFWGRWLDWAAV